MAKKDKKIFLFFIISLSFLSLIIFIKKFIKRDSNLQNNVILVAVDTLRADHLGCYGYDRKTSPNIDSLAKDSLLFKTAIAQSPWTLPSFASMFTSLYPSQHKAGLIEKKLNDSFITLAEILKNKGYYNVAFTGGAYLSKEFGLSQGFDLFKEFNTPTTNDIQEVISSAIEWLKRQNVKKFFLFIHSYQPHSPYWPPSEFDVFSNNYQGKISGDIWKDIGIEQGKLESRYKTLPDQDRQRLIDLYDGDILCTDYWIGNLIKSLKELNLYQDSLLIFTSDHGEEFGEHGAWEHGHSLYNEVIRVPLIIKFPRGKNKGVSLKMAELVDLIPTILDILNIKINHPIEGKSLLKESENNFAFSQAFPLPNLLAFQEENIKVIIDYDKGQAEMFNLENDTSEKINIFASDFFNFYRNKIGKYPLIELKKEALKEKELNLSPEVVEKLRALGYVK